MLGKLWRHGSSSAKGVDATLAFTKLTCVHYERGDALGKLLAHASLLPVLLIVAQASRAYARREVHELAAFVGLVAAEVSARALKHALRSPRPAASCARLGVCDAHGMPSSHAAVAFAYFALAAAGAAAAWRARGRAARLTSALEVAGSAVMAAAVAASRVYLGYHTRAQVAAGAALGLAFGVAWWFAMQTAASAGWFRAVGEWPVARDWLYLKDTWGVPEPLAVEQQAAYGGGGNDGGSRAARKKRS